MIKYTAGDIVIYTNGPRKEMGTVKRVLDEQTVFVWYHTGETAAATSVRDLKPFKESDYSTISNKHAYEVLKERSRKIKQEETI